MIDIPTTTISNHTFTHRICWVAIDVEHFILKCSNTNFHFTKQDPRRVLKKMQNSQSRFFLSKGRVEMSEGSAVEVQSLWFAYGSGGATTVEDGPGHKVLRNCSFSLPLGSRCLVVGLNGSGKSTLMRCLAGMHFHQHDQIRVLGKPAFFDSSLGAKVSYLGSEWRTNPVVRSDVSIERLLEGAVGYTAEKSRFLCELLDLSREGRMHRLSDGQRQAVQMACGLMREWSVLLLDETTVECDVVVRKRLLEHLKETTSRGQATVMYATHVFDSLQTWPTHVLHVKPDGTTQMHLVDQWETYLEVKKTWSSDKGSSPLAHVVEKLLESDWEARKIIRNQHQTKPKEETVEQKLANDKRYGDRFYDYSH